MIHPDLRSSCCLADVRATGSGTVRFARERFDLEPADLEGADLDYDTLSCDACGHWLTLAYTAEGELYLEERPLPGQWEERERFGNEIDTLAAKGAAEQIGRSTPA
jgi:hypothetical protein